MSYLVPSVAPRFGEVVRINAQEIQVTWNQITDGKEGVTGYLVKYRPIFIIQKRNTEDLSIVIETTQTSFVISELDPRVSYGVSVAARNTAGVGIYSSEFIVKSE